MADVKIQLGYKDQAWFDSNPSFVLDEGQPVYLEQTGTYKMGNGSTQLSSLVFLPSNLSVSFSSITGDPYDNANLTSALNLKADQFDLAQEITNRQDADTALQSDIDTHEARTDNPHAVTAAQVGSYTTGQVDAFLSAKENTSNKGVANGYAPLDSGVKIASAYLPSYVDDVLEFANLAAFPAIGETGKIYIAIDTSKEYRWSGSIYVNIAKGDVQTVNGQTGIVTLTTANVPEDPANLYFTNARAQAAAPAETATTIAAINHGATAKTTPVDADEITGQDSANSFSLIRITLLNIYNYIKAKTDLVYQNILDTFAASLSSLPDTITAAQANSWLRINVLTNGNLTIPPNSSVAIPIGSKYFIRQSGAGSITLVPGAGVTLNAPGGVLTTGSQYDVIRLVKQATDSWLVEVGAASWHASVTVPLVATKGNVQPVYSAKWRTTPYAGTPSATAGLSGFVVYVPYYVSETHNVTDIGIEVTTAVAASNIALALYTDSNGQPGTLIQQTGALPSITTGLKSALFSPVITLSASSKIVWMAIQLSSNSLGVRSSSTNVTLTYTTGIGVFTGCYTQAQAFGSFPANATPVATTSNGFAVLIDLKAQ